MFSHRHKYIFVHIPKTGGSSLEHQLYTAESRQRYHNWLPPHFTIKQYAEVFSTKFFDECYKWTVIRNPYERFLSAYYHRKHFFTQDGNHTAVAVSIDDFALGKPGIEYRKDDSFHLIPQHEFTHINGICMCDGIYRYEDGLDSIVNLVCQRIRERGFTKFPVFDRVNFNEFRLPRERKPYYEVMSPQAIAAVTERYKVDFETFGYHIHQ